MSYEMQDNEAFTRSQTIIQKVGIGGLLAGGIAYTIADAAQRYDAIAPLTEGAQLATHLALGASVCASAVMGVRHMLSAGDRNADSSHVSD